MTNILVKNMKIRSEFVSHKIGLLRQNQSLMFLISCFLYVIIRCTSILFKQYSSNNYLLTHIWQTTKPIKFLESRKKYLNTGKQRWRKRKICLFLPKLWSKIVVYDHGKITADSTKVTDKA